VERVEIQPAGVAQVHRALRTGRRVLITEDVQDIASDLKEIRATLKLEFDPDSDLFVVMDVVTNPDGSIEDKLVTVWDVERNGQLDRRLVERIREIAAPGYDLVAELEKRERQDERDRSSRFREQVGPAAEKLKWALRKDLGADKNRAFIPGGARG
jgi:hypothetical protein